MNKKAEADFGDLLWENIIYIIVLVIFVILIFVFVSAQKNGAAVWEDYYAKEIVKVISLSQPGDEIRMDVHKGTVIAKKNGIINFKEIFLFDNLKNEVCVKLDRGRKTCFFFNKEVDIVDYELKLGVPTNVLTFKVADVKKAASSSNEEVKNG